MKKIRLVLFLCVFMLLFMAAPNVANACSGTTNVANADIFDDLSQMFVPKQESKELGSVIVGGIPLGITLDSDGIEVIGFSEIITEDGAVCPAAECGLEIGDKIIKIDGNTVNKSDALSRAANDCGGRALQLVYLRNGTECNTLLTPKRDVLSGKFKLGLWVKNVSNGIGTLTFVKDGKCFGALGHPITSKNGDVVEICGGKVYECSILGVNKGVKGDAGELKGTFFSSEKIGEICKNNKFGIYGKFEKLPQKLNVTKVMQVANINEVRPGRAQILSTIEGDTPELYDVEIIKVTNQTQKDDKGLVLKVVDKTLLDKAGGIVQGMSGSPIIQNGKLVGAVTHVFINDPTKGFGMFAQWMLSE